MPKTPRETLTKWGLLRFILLSRPTSRIALISSSFIGACLGVGAALAQKEFVDTLSNQNLHLIDLQLPAMTWLLIASGAFLGSLLFSQATNYLGSRESYLAQGQLAQRLYNKILSLQPQQMKGRSVGETVSIYTTDIPGCTIFLDQSMPAGFGIFFPLILAPIILVSKFAIAPNVVFSCLFTALILNFGLAYRQSIFFFHFKSLAAARIGLVNEWIQNIRGLRVLDWVPAFEKKIITTRETETSNRIRMLSNGQTMNAVSSSSTYLLNVIFVSWLANNSTAPLTPGTLLALLWIVAVFLNRPFRQLPWFFTFVFDGWTSLKRLHVYLSMEPTTPQVFAPAPAISTNSALEVVNLNLQLSNQQILKNINLTINKQEFVALVGEVGCGKTSLLLSLIGETPCEMQSYQVHGQCFSSTPRQDWARSFALVPQEGFVVSASLRENVGFEYLSMNEAADNEKQILESLTAAHFNPQDERLERALETDIGERGVNLSGGQRQRVSLARAHFFDRDILLLDDSFSALDERTEKSLIDLLILGEWKHKTKLVATHRLSVLEKANRILFMHQGQIADQGSFADLIARNPEFKKFVQSVQQKVKVAEVKTPEPTSEVFGEK